MSGIAMSREEAPESSEPRSDSPTLRRTLAARRAPQSGSGRGSGGSSSGCQNKGGPPRAMLGAGASLEHGLEDGLARPRLPHTPPPGGESSRASLRPSRQKASAVERLT